MAKSKKKLYEEMTITERKIAICKDVIAQINLGDMDVEEGSAYLYGDVPSSLQGIGINHHITKEQGREIQKSCEMCARGALMIAKVAKFNEVSLGNLGISDECKDIFNATASVTSSVLSEAFTKMELDYIEAVFEGYQSRPIGRRFYEDHENPKDRLIAICQNIIDYGEFKPSIRYDIVEYEIYP